MKKLMDLIGLGVAVPVAAIIMGIRMVSAILQLPIVAIGFVLLAPIEFIQFWMEDGRTQAWTEIKRYPRDFGLGVADLFIEAVWPNG